MRELVEHLWRTNREEIVSKSLSNCHCRGLYELLVKLSGLGFNWSIHCNQGNCAGEITGPIGFRVIVCKTGAPIAGFEAPTLIEALKKATE